MYIDLIESLFSSDTARSTMFASTTPTFSRDVVQFEYFICLSFSCLKEVRLPALLTSHPVDVGMLLPVPEFFSTITSILMGLLPPQNFAFRDVFLRQTLLFVLFRTYFQQRGDKTESASSLTSPRLF